MVRYSPYVTAGAHEEQRFVLVSILPLHLQLFLQFVSMNLCHWPLQYPFFAQYGQLLLLSVY